MSSNFSITFHKIKRSVNFYERQKTILNTSVIKKYIRNGSLEQINLICAFKSLFKCRIGTSRRVVKRQSISQFTLILRQTLSINRVIPQTSRQSACPRRWKWLLNI
ncbi:hypothetical protein PUN28_000985 [Cardiocondyla obscurior]|uniref:Ribosomal protein S14 n=1 Tax=Cardiocondyla obscurior TaxID=286306 RepID=A0AAW2H2B2_9HYME